MISIHMNDISFFWPLRGAENPFTFNILDHLILNLPVRVGRMGDLLVVLLEAVLSVMCLYPLLIWMRIDQILG